MLRIGQGVAGVDELDQFARLDMRIDLGRRDIGMPEHLLQRPQIGAPREQVSRERMAQDVRADAVGRDPRLGGERLTIWYRRIRDKCPLPEGNSQG